MYPNEDNSKKVNMFSLSYAILSSINNLCTYLSNNIFKSAEHNIINCNEFIYHFWKLMNMWCGDTIHCRLFQTETNCRLTQAFLHCQIKTFYFESFFLNEYFSNVIQVQWTLSLRKRWCSGQFHNSNYSQNRTKLYWSNMQYGDLKKYIAVSIKYSFYCSLATLGNSDVISAIERS